MTPKPVFSAGIALCGSRPVSCCLFAVFAQRSLSIPNSAVPNKHHLFPTSHCTDEVCCISCPRTWHNHLTNHTLDFSLSSVSLHHPHHSSPSAPSGGSALLNISQICHYPCILALIFLTWIVVISHKTFGICLCLVPFYNFFVSL